MTRDDDDKSPAPPPPPQGISKSGWDERFSVRYADGTTDRGSIDPSLGSIVLHGVGLAGDGQDPLPRAAAHVEAPRRVLHQLGDGDVHLGERG